MRKIESLRQIAPMDISDMMKNNITTKPTMELIKQAFENTGLYKFNEAYSGEYQCAFSVNTDEIAKQLGSLPDDATSDDDDSVHVTVHIPGYIENSFIVKTVSGRFMSTCVLIGNQVYSVMPCGVAVNLFPILWVYDE